MAGKGGARPGAGRKSKLDKYLNQIVDAEDRIADRLPRLVDNMMKLADGVTLMEETRDGGTRVYLEPPDRQANEYLINRILGKPTERVEHTGEDGDPMEVTATIRDVASVEIETWRKMMAGRLPMLEPPRSRSEDDDDDGGH